MQQAILNDITNGIPLVIDPTTKEIGKGTQTIASGGNVRYKDGTPNVLATDKENDHLITTKTVVVMVEDQNQPIYDPNNGSITGYVLVSTNVTKNTGFYIFNDGEWIKYPMTYAQYENNDSYVHIYNANEINSSGGINSQPTVVDVMVAGHEMSTYAGTVNLNGAYASNGEVLGLASMKQEDYIILNRGSSSPTIAGSQRHASKHAKVSIKDFFEYFGVGFKISNVYTNPNKEKVTMTMVANVAQFKNHTLNTTDLQVTIYDSTGKIIYPTATVITATNVTVTTATAGIITIILTR
jgi:hypothetical protein